MPKIIQQDHLVTSDTKYITMCAQRDGPSEDTWCCELCPPHEHQETGECDLCKPHSHEHPRDWYLTINMSGADISFLAAEGLEGYMVTEEEAMTRINEFEANMQAEKQDCVEKMAVNLFKNVSSKLG